MMSPPFSSTEDQPGVHYARTVEGLRLPIVDVTHPAFALKVTEAQQADMIDSFVRETRPLNSLPEPIRGLMLRFFLRGSVLAKGIRRSRGTFMSGMDTYLLKLGPEMLASVSGNAIDRRIASALPALGVRLRLQDMAELMAGVLSSMLSAQTQRPLVFINIAGGPALDSLNALILLRRKSPTLLSQREIRIDVLDRDEDGPAFGAAALAALSTEGAPLHELRVALRRVDYDWARAQDLRPLLDELHDAGQLAIASSEGGLFEYGSDSEIADNLKILRTCAELTAVVGSITRDDEATRMLHNTSPVATRRRGLDVFRALARKSGWEVSEAMQRPFSDQVVLR